MMMIMILAPEKSLDGFKEKCRHFRAWCLDCAFDTRVSDHCGKLN